MTWREAGRERTWWVDSNGSLVLRWRPILVEEEDQDPEEDPLDLLTGKQRFVIELRYGLRDGYEYTQREVAALMGISRSMANQHEQAAIKRLRKHLRRAPAPQSEGRERNTP